MIVLLVLKHIYASEFIIVVQSKPRNWLLIDHGFVHKKFPRLKFNNCWIVVNV